MTEREFLRREISILDRQISGYEKKIQEEKYANPADVFWYWAGKRIAAIQIRETLAERLRGLENAETN